MMSIVNGLIVNNGTLHSVKLDGSLLIFDVEKWAQFLMEEATSAACDSVSDGNYDDEEFYQSLASEIDDWIRYNDPELNDNSMLPLPLYVRSQVGFRKVNRGNLHKYVSDVLLRNSRTVAVKGSECSFILDADRGELFAVKGISVVLKNSGDISGHLVKAEELVEDLKCYYMTPSSPSIVQMHAVVG